MSTFILCILSSSGLYCAIESYYKNEIIPSASNYGNTGILELPNARFMQEASLRFNFSSSYPHEFTTLTATPFHWLEATYRYVELKDQNYGPSSYSGNQSLKDKAFDLKFKILDETFYTPSIALGIRDLAGTALFSSEYLVSTKGLGNFDLTIGLGWGALGNDDNFSNPLKSFNDNFKDRNNELGQGGTFQLQSWFSGKTSLLGGIEYNLKKYGIKFKLEYDTTNPDDKPRFPQAVNSRFNYGLTYYFSKNLHLGAAYERGNQFRVSFVLNGNFLEDSIPKPSPKNVISLNQEQRMRAYEDKDIFYRSLNRSLKDESILLQAASYEEHTVDVAVATTRFQSFTRTAGRTARIVSALSKEDVETINIHSMNGDIEIAKISLNRKEFDSAGLSIGSPQEILNKSTIDSNNHNPLYASADFMPRVNFPEFNWSMSPSVKSQIGGPEGFYLGQLFWKTDLSLKLKRNLIIYSSIGINIYDTFDDFNNPSSSTIPHVRSDIQFYLEQGKNNLSKLQLQYFHSPMKDVFFRADLGLMEDMFGGFGGEILYRPIDRNFSFGFSAHRVRQRGYEQRFSFLDYETTTGHLGFYYDLPYEVNAQMLIGKYLAGDKGVTLDLSRRFKSGFTLGIFATKTNLSAEEFGEGSFDKGFYISVPTEMLYSDFTTGNIGFGLHPLTKDGGALLNQHNSLFSILGDTNRSAITRDWELLLD